MRNRLIWVAIVLGILWLASCGEDGPATTSQPTPPATQATETVASPPAEKTTEPAPAPKCDKLSKADLEAVKFVAKDKEIDISAGAALPLPVELQEFSGVTFTRVIALDTADAGMIPIFATDDDLIEFVGVNDDAIKHFHTLAGITTEPGTPIQEYRDRLSDSDEVATVEDCVIAGQ
jgi:hypothetical protein